MTKRLAFMLALSLGACAGSGSGRVQYAATVTVRSPQLVNVEPDVYVLADADEPVFFTDNYYWLYRSGGWYRSHSYDRDWVSVSTPSRRLRAISQPTAYVRYRTQDHEARNMPAPQSQPNPYDNDQPRRDFVPQPEPQQPPQAYPRPPQQLPPTRDDVRVPDDGKYERGPAQPPGQIKHDGRIEHPNEDADERYDHDHLDDKADKPKHEDKKDKKAKKHDH